MLIPLAKENIESAFLDTHLGWLVIIPFFGLIFSMALIPLASDHFWHKNKGKITIFWGALLVSLMTLKHAPHVVMQILLNTVFHHYMPFIILIATLYFISGGVHLHIDRPINPLVNTLFLAFGSILSSLIGTTGSAMLLIRPFLHMNSHRRYKTHLPIFFIFSVANIGGGLSAIGDPPLFVGFLQGVPFLWPTENLFLPFLWVMLPLLCIFFLLDYKFLQKETLPQTSKKIKIQGIHNLLLLFAVVAVILLTCQNASCEHVNFFGIQLKQKDLLRDVLLLALMGLSWLLTPKRIYQAHNFSLAPITEVAVVFAGIFITIAPIQQILSTQVSFAPSAMNYFWLSGAMSAFLDNAPTYLLFFSMAGGDPVQLTTQLKDVLIAISTGSVFMGALTYIGNAPNLMIKGVAKDYHVAMPSFFGYLGWAVCILLPLLAIMSWWFF